METALKPIADYLLGTFEYETTLTKGVFQAVPNDHLDYHPDAKSKTALVLLRHIALSDPWLVNGVADGRLPSHPDDTAENGIRTPADALARYEQAMPKAIARAKAASEQDLAREIDFLGMLMISGIDLLSLALRHSIHHRGQLATYLRAMGGKVPPIYGNSADSA
jgi:uncharacterized damage-inducible protein DinB